MAEPLPHESPRAHRYLRIALSILLATLVVLLLILLAQYRTLQRQTYFVGRGSMLSSLKNHGTITPKDAAFIESWMTFDYINRIFSLPPSYLQSALTISNTRYPRITIEEYAEQSHLTLAAFLTQVENAVQSYTPR